MVYADAGCVLNLEPPAARARLGDYLEQADRHGISFMQQRHVEERWSKADTMDRIGLAPADRRSGQYLAGVLVLRSTSTTIDLVDAWLALCEEDDHRFLDDRPGRVPDAVDFREHRHDQAILSGLAKRADVPAIADETAHRPHWATEGASSPIWCARHRWGAAFVPQGGPGMRLVPERLLDRAERAAVGLRSRSSPSRGGAGATARGGDED